MKTITLGQLQFGPKSKHKAGDGSKTGTYKFFTSSTKQSKFSEFGDYEGPALIFGTGGKASIHYCEKKFSTTADCYVITTDNKKIFLKYIYLYLKGSIYLLEEGFKGAGLKHISKDYLKQIQIPLPPLATQRAIADKLDKLQSLIHLKEQAITKTDELTKSIFLEMFGDPMKNEKGWKIKKIKDLLDSSNYGTSQKANEDGEGIEILRMNNITYSGDWDLDSMKHITFKGENDYEKYTVKQGDILFNRTNSKELVGKTALYNFEEPRAFAGYLVRLRTNKSLAHPQFVTSFLNSDYGKATLFGMAKSIVGMANINAQEVQSIDIYFPPLTLQQKFADIITQIEAQKSEHKLALAKLEELYQATMQDSFKL